MHARYAGKVSGLYLHYALDCTTVALPLQRACPTHAQRPAHFGPCPKTTATLCAPLSEAIASRSPVLARGRLERLPFGGAFALLTRPERRTFPAEMPGELFGVGQRLATMGAYCRRLRHVLPSVSLHTHNAGQMRHPARCLTCYLGQPIARDCRRQTDPSADLAGATSLRPCRTGSLRLCQ